MLVWPVMLLTFASWIYWLVAVWLVYDFFRSPAPLDTTCTPPVSILKAVKGLDAQAYENFASFCDQDYPEFEVLFGVADADDPVIPVIAQLRRAFPQRHIRHVVVPVCGANRKASILHHLATLARYDVLVASDSDMRVTPDYLRHVVAPLADPRIGLVTCPYRGTQPVTFTARLEALYMSVCFLPSMIVGRLFLGMRFALGSSVAVRRGDLDRIGGFAAVADYLADDYQIGERIAAAGLRVHLSTCVLASVLGATNFSDQWAREVRWARCIRISRPIEYPGLLLTFSTPLAALLLLLMGFAPLAWLVLAISVVLRWLVAWLVAGCVGDRPVRRWLIWLPIRDMLSALVWVFGAVGHRICWRGERYILQSDGRLRPLEAHERPAVVGSVHSDGLRHVAGGTDERKQ